MYHFIHDEQYYSNQLLNQLLYAVALVKNNYTENILNNKHLLFIINYIHVTNIINPYFTNNYISNKCCYFTPCLIITGFLNSKCEVLFVNIHHEINLTLEILDIMANQNQLHINDQIQIFRQI
jgi:Na+-transporting NADH:ubiquinone oxidoreductase subunit NqrB